MTEQVIQKFFDDAVAQGLAPGFQFAVFDKDSLIASGSSGLVDAVSGTPFRNDHIIWLASCSKLSISIMVLHILEKGLCPNGMTLADLDDHEKLVQVLPEFKHGSTSLVSKIIVGFEKELGSDGKKVPILRDYEGKVTLRMLLTHTSGLAYYVCLSRYIY
jgi:methyl acetate hydrolase